MKKLFSHIYIILTVFLTIFCTTAETQAMSPANDRAGDINQISTMDITINGKTVSCHLADNAATRELIERLSQGEITYEANEYGGFEMVGYIGFSLPTSDTQITTQTGDVMLYTGNNICIFAGQNSWAYTPIGKIEGMSTSELRSFLNMDNRNATITLSLSTSGLDEVFAGHPNNVRKGIYTLNGKRLSQAPDRGAYIEDGIKKIK